MRATAPRITLVLIAAIVAFAAISATASAEDDTLSLEDLLGTEINTASKYDETSREAPASVTIITAEEISRFGYRTLAEVLNNVRGFYTSSDRNYGYVGVRGFSRPTDYNARILLQVNGLTLNENFYGSVGVDTDFPFNMESVERIEIVRGPGSALYGTGAMLGVVNVITRGGDAQDGLTLSVESGNLGRQHGSLVWGKRFDNGMNFLVSGNVTDIDGEDLYFEEFDDPESNDGIAENVDWEKMYSTFAMIEYKGLEVQAYHGTGEKGIPTASYDTVFNDPRSETKDQWTTLDARYNFELGTDKTLMMRGYLNDYHYDGLYPYEDDYLSFDENDSSWYGLETRFGWDKANNRLILGAEYQDNSQAYYRSWDNEGYEYFNDDLPFQVVSFYIQDSYQATKNLAVTVGVRQDEYSDLDESSTTPRLALVYHPNEDSTLKALYGRAFRRPNHYERFYDDEDYNKANLDLDPEEMATYELIWEQKIGKRFYGTVSAFHYDMDDLISGIEDPEDELVQFQNIDKVTSNGLEFELNARLKNGIWGYASYTYQETTDEGTDLRLSNSPESLLRAGVSMPLTDTLSGALQARYESERTTVYDTELSSYLIADLHLTARFQKRFGVGFHVFNLLDEDYEVPGGFEHVQDGIVQRGRNLRVSISVRP